MNETSSLTCGPDVSTAFNGLTREFVFRFKSSGYHEKTYDYVRTVWTEEDFREMDEKSQLGIGVNVRPIQRVPLVNSSEIPKSSENSPTIDKVPPIS